MNVISALQQYMNYTFDQTPGMKVLLMDSNTIPIISILFSMTEIIQKEVYLVQQLSDLNRDTLLHLNAICLLKPTKENFELLKTELNSPKYNFTNFVDSSQLSYLSQSDVHEVVQKVIELYVDYIPINDDLFITSCPNYYSVVSKDSFSLEQQTISSLISLCLSLRKNPIIRYQQNSELSKRIAEGLSQQLEHEKKLFGNNTGTTLIILDRIFDPITPLLTQWTYQAMIHEFIGFNNGKILIGDKPVVFSNDKIFDDSMYYLFSDATDLIIKNVNEVTNKAGINSKQYSSIEEMKNVIESIPQLKKESAGVKKHLSIMNEINKIVNQRKMFEVSRLEQDIVCGTGKQELYNNIIQFFSGPYSEEDKLRIGMLYCIRYEDKIHDIIEEMIIKGISREKAQLIEILIRYAGITRRPLEIFTKVKSVVNFVKKNVSGIENAFIQHKPILENLFDPLINQQLLDKFPFCKSGNSSGRDFIIFIVGGVTFEEEVSVAIRNRNNPTQKIIIGGTDLLNTTKFIEQINCMKK